MKPLVLLAAVAATMLISGCSEKASEEIDFGVVENGVYRNEYFGMRVTLPDGWEIQSEETVDELERVGGALVTSDEGSLKALRKAAELNVVKFFLASKHPVGAPVENNANLTAFAERVKHMPGIKTGSDYIFHMLKTLKSGQLDYSFGTSTNILLDGVEFTAQPATLSFLNQEIQQEFICAVDKGYVITFSLTYRTEEDKATLLDTLRTVTFD